MLELAVTVLRARYSLVVTQGLGPKRTQVVDLYKILLCIIIIIESVLPCYTKLCAVWENGYYIIYLIYARMCVYIFWLVFSLTPFSAVYPLLHRPLTRMVKPFLRYTDNVTPPPALRKFA